MLPLVPVHLPEERRREAVVALAVTSLLTCFHLLRCFNISYQQGLLRSLNTVKAWILRNVMGTF